MINRSPKGGRHLSGVDFEPRISRQLFQCNCSSQQPAASTRCGEKGLRELMGRRGFDCTPSFPRRALRGIFFGQFFRARDDHLKPIAAGPRLRSCFQG